MANVFKSRYTGEQIEQLLKKAEGIQTVVAFPDLQDGDYLGAIEIDNRPYLIPKGTSVNANEGAREGGYLYTLEIGTDKFLLPKYVEAINATSAGSGTPLKKLTIGDTLYEIPQGVEVKANDGAVEGGYLYTITIGVDKYLLPKYVEAITTSSVPEGVELKGLTIGNQTYTIPAGVNIKANDGAVEGGYLRTLTIGTDKFLLPDYITPNPAAEATQTLNKMAINDTIYQLPQGGGANVEANPSGDVTATLNKIGINNVVYGLPAGGGGASGGGYDLTIQAYMGDVGLTAFKADGTQVNYKSYTETTVLHNVTGFYADLKTISLYISLGFAFAVNKVTTAGTPAKIITRLSQMSVYKEGDYNAVYCVLLGNCTVYHIND